MVAFYALNKLYIEKTTRSHHISIPNTLLSLDSYIVARLVENHTNYKPSRTFKSTKVLHTNQTVVKN